ncbi:MAG TPA: hypothetical protein VK612_11950 [Pyrinomonadaceae bacterium]|nr:hypothetical protein [Pyrinomonadaceae bacterium]
MATNFTLYVKNKGGSAESAKKAILLLQGYLPALIERNKAFASADAVLVDDKTTPVLLDTDVVVYVVSRVGKSVISEKGGDVSQAFANGNILGLTDLNLKICEVYFDRMYEGSPKELAGACYHEAAHIKSNMDDKMHDDQNGFLKGGPDYNGTPTDKNNDFLAKHLGRKVSMNSGL